MTDSRPDRDKHQPSPQQSAGTTGERTRTDQPAAADRSADDRSESEKNEKVLHTRISPSLDREIKRRARNLGMSVSTVVRNVLLHTFDLVEDIVNDSANVAMSMAGDDTAQPQRSGDPRKSGRGDAKPSTDATDSNAPGPIIGWQIATLNLNAVCDRCNEIISKGGKAAIAIRDGAGARSIICVTCLDSVGADGDQGDTL